MIDQEQTEMLIAGIVVDPANNAPIVILKDKTALDFTESFENYDSAYDLYDTDFLVKIKNILEKNKNSNLVNYLKLPKEEEKK